MSALAADPGLRSRSTAVLAVASLAVALAALRWAAPFAQFDGGISSSAATFTLHGLLPYRDYWLLYGPLGGYLLTPVTAIFGPSLDLVRVCGLIVIFAQGGTAFVIVRSWAPHAAAMLIAIAAVLLPAALIGIEFSPWALAMTLALAGLYLAGRSANRPLVAGLLLGLAFASRLDVGAYALFAALLTRDRRSILAGFAIVAVPTVALSLLTTPIADLAEQLIWYPLLGLRQYRSVPGIEFELPFPMLAAFVSIPLVLIPRALIGGSVARLLLVRPTDRLVGAVTVFALLCQLQTLGRADIHHFSQAATPALLLLATFLIPARRLSPLVLAVPIALVVSVIALGIGSGFFHSGDPRDMDLERAARATTALTARDEPIFVALSANRYTFINPLVAYYLADRRPGTTFTLFNPGVTNTDAIQARMVAELAASRTRVLVLDDKYSESFESVNESRIPGSTLLDDYITADFHRVCTFGDYWLMARSEPGEPVPACPSPEVATP
jgi:hypothetical protein